MSPWRPRCDPPPRLVRPVPLDSTGRTGPTRGQSQRGRWRQTSKGLYVPAGVDSTVPEQRAIEQSARLGPSGAVTGWASLRLQGAAYFDGYGLDGRTPRPLLLASPDRQLRPSEAVRALREPVPPTERILAHGVWVTSPERALLDEMCGLDLWEGVVAADMAMAAALTSLARMRRYVASRPRRRNRQLVLDMLALADEHSASARETLTRLVWVIVAGLSPPLCNQPVFSLHGELLGVPDLFDPESGTVVDFDGSDHRSTVARHHDVGREELMRVHGLEYVTVLEPDLRDRARLGARFVDARERGLGRVCRDDASWTLMPPPGWPMPISLDDRLDVADLSAEARATARW
ncbi:hypothetical protein GCM10027600_06210 [Nocardioides ginsengisegetis]